MPKIVGNGVDLSKLQLRINYQNASKMPSGKGNKTNYANHFIANDIIAKEKIEILESKQNEVKADIDNLAVQSNNLIIAVGIDNVKKQRILCINR